MRFKKQSALESLLIAVSISMPVLGDSGTHPDKHNNKPNSSVKHVSEKPDVVKRHIGEKIDGVYFDPEYAKKNNGFHGYVFPPINGLPQASCIVLDNNYDIRYSSDMYKALNDKRLIARSVNFKYPNGEEVYWGEEYEIGKTPIKDPSKLEKGCRIPTREELKRFYERK